MVRRVSISAWALNWSGPRLQMRHCRWRPVDQQSQAMRGPPWKGAHACDR